MAREVLAQRVLAFLLAQVVTSPDGSAYPNSCNTDDHYDDEDDPLVVSGYPVMRDKG